MEKWTSPTVVQPTSSTRAAGEVPLALQVTGYVPVRNAEVTSTRRRSV
jgi:hypothetical protein